MDLENLREEQTSGETFRLRLLPPLVTQGCQRLACESEEIVQASAHSWTISSPRAILQAIFERLGILHCRTSRIETALGLPPEPENAAATDSKALVKGMSSASFSYVMPCYLIIFVEAVAASRRQ